MPAPPVLETLLPLPLPLWLFSMGVVFAAGVVRGFSGFGFSALCVAALSLVLPPAAVVPPIFVLEIVASLSLLRGAWAGVQWRWMLWLALGNAVFIPLGIAVLAWVPELHARLLIGAMLLGVALALRSGWRIALEPTPGVGLAAGVVSGFFNGAAAVGGMAVAVLFSAANVPPAVMRATMIVFLLWTDVYSLAWAAGLSTLAPGAQSLVGLHTLWTAAWLLPATVAGVWVGQRSFAGVPPHVFRKRVLNLIAVIALTSMLRALYSIAMAP